MAGHTISNDDLSAINLLESTTGARASDVVIEPESVVFVVAKGDLGKAIGKQGANINRLRRQFGRDVQVVEEAEGLAGFIANILAPAQVKELRESDNGGRKVVTVIVDPKQKGLAIGRGGERIRKARLLVKRHYGVEDVKIV